jgi:hypothetical protein
MPRDCVKECVILSVFSDVFKPKRKVDSVFGTVEYRKPLFSFSFWQGEVLFSPLKKRVKVYVAAGSSGISESQREFYRELEKRYHELTDAICKILFETLAIYWGDMFREQKPQEFWRGFELERLFIPKPKKSTDYWELTYLHPLYNNTYTIYLDGWKPIYGEIDD